MKQHRRKRFFAGLMTAAIAVTAPVSVLTPLTASAAIFVEESSFDRKIIPWIPFQASPARQNVDLKDGAAHITILHPEGKTKSQSDLQFRLNNLKFRKGHEYTISFKVKANRAGLELASHICNFDDSERYFVLDGSAGEMHAGPDMGGSWGSVLKLTTEYQEITAAFIPTEDIPYSEWRFQYGYDTNGFGGNAKQGDEIWFDDMSIVDAADGTDADGWRPDYGYISRQHCIDCPEIAVNQLGYFQGLEKHATLSDNAGDSGLDYWLDMDHRPDNVKLELTGAYDYEIVNEDGGVVHTGRTEKVFYDRDSGDHVCRIDFTEFRTPGTYCIRIKDTTWTSPYFKISANPYQTDNSDLMTDALNLFRFCRADSKLEHNPREKDGYIQPEWDPSLTAEFDGADIKGCEKIDVYGGWFTGDTADKDMIQAGSTVWTLQNMFERAVTNSTGRQDFTDGDAALSGTDRKNGIPDILEACRYELDFMTKMKVQPTETEWGEYAGLYHHMLLGVGLTPYDAYNYYERTAPPADADYTKAAYKVQPPTLAATLNYAACAAQGARLWAEYDKNYAAALYKSAKDAYQAYLDHAYEPEDPAAENNNGRSLYAPFTIPTTDLDVSDEAYWAASELFITATDRKDADADTYYQALSGYKDAFTFQERVYGGDSAVEEGSFTMYTSTNTAAAGSMSLLLHDSLLDYRYQDKLFDSLRDTADSYLDEEDRQGYGTPYQYDGSGIFPDGNALRGVAGYEFNSNGRVLSNLTAMAYAYDLTGDADYLNGMVRGMDYLLGNNPLLFSYITGCGDHSVQRPDHRYYDSIWANRDPIGNGTIVSGPNACAGFYDRYAQLYGMTIDAEDSYSQRCYLDSALSWSTNQVMLSNNAMLAWIVSFIQDESVLPVTVRGDVNGDGTINNDDADALLKFLQNRGSVKVPSYADINADACVNAVDLTLLKRYLLEK
ncbi:MAG: glycoside hydrolase family 9 protein [Oscillospiraceae bacterium]|nr:glycoside hydrolase family 9 protein [Oscillospiraceae bacterium]